MKRESGFFLPVFVVAYVVAVQGLAALVVHASIIPQDNRLTDDQHSALLAAHAYCHDRRRGVSESLARQRAFHEQSDGQQQGPGQDTSSVTLFKSAIAEVCPRFQVGSNASTL